MKCFETIKERGCLVQLSGDKLLCRGSAGTAFLLKIEQEMLSVFEIG